MIAVIFEVILTKDRSSEYLNLAGELKPSLEQMDGFISIERFQSLSDSQKLLSLSFWKDEASVSAWRNLSAHRSAQSKGRSGIFENFRLRVSHIIRDYGLMDREQAPEDSQSFHINN